MKSLSSKLLAFTFIIALATGCASVTDAGLAEQPQEQTIEQVTPPAPDLDPVKGTGAKAEPMVDKPKL
ncbi:hypothetical protein G3570_11615 [Balneolaceae bacterium YR4-1]|uniref:Uncharacterized protein n=1 Tax=Halalkalibaculum roseum TaxID=2709311 RepID=A0A6M1T5K4_9BACT|nr:hypothetical protein [Halalkalibaculum roseum]NGP77285.1 hypothetical protein [Halalkalibaculum roseum]NGP77286.1 hypothetical protein [Halalkalibaculum roseum]NGP77287.1 hypothetical protein [Halalkalibaculum roseum]